MGYSVYVDSFAHFLRIGKIEDMNDNFGTQYTDLTKNTKEGVSTKAKMAIAGGALLAVTGGVMLENHKDDVSERQRQEHSQAFERTSVEAGFPARESIPLDAFRAVDEYKSILGETWSVPFVPGANSEQEKMIEHIAQKHGVTKKDFAQAFRYKVNDAGLE